MADIDFNLMPVFEALFEERRVGRAAMRLGLTQSAVSQSLGRLRHALHDQLFLRTPQGLVPTVRAQELAPLVQEALARWRAACRQGSFDPAVSTREFRLVIGGYIGEMLLPKIIEALQRQSDTVALRVWNMSSSLGEWLEGGMADMAVGTFEQLPKRIKAHRLFQHRFVWAARIGHPTAFSLKSLPDILALPRVELDAGEGPTSSKGVWSEGGIGRRAVPNVRSLLLPGSPATPQSANRFHLHHWRVAFEVASKSDLVIFVPERLVRVVSADYGMAILDQFPPVPHSNLSLVWDETRTSEPGNQWLRRLIIDTVGEEDAG